MKKTCCLLLLLSCFVLQACEKADNLKYETSSYANYSASENSENIAKTEDTAEVEITEIEETKEETSYIDIVVEKNQNMIYLYEEILNQDLLGKDFINKVGQNSIRAEANAYLEEEKETFEPKLNESGTFPNELVLLFEEALYHFFDEENQEEETSYDKTVNALGAEELILDIEDLYVHFPKIAAHENQLQWKDETYELIRQFYNIPIKCLDCFYVPSVTENDKYIFVYQSGGSNGAVSVCLTERIGDEFVIINTFETPNVGNGKVIYYGEELYYVYLQYNYPLKVYDGIKIHRLTNNPEKDNLFVRYLPKQYIWRNSHCASMYLTDSKDGELIENYIEEIKMEITSEPYLDRGTCQYGMYVYYGEEEKTTDFTLGAYEDAVYKMDIANCDVPVYFWKTEYSPSNIGTAEFLRTKFYLYDAQTDSALELERLNNEFEAPRDIRLVQMWFKEIEGKVYTFRMYHVSDYNYMLNVMLLEQDKVTQLKAYLLLPQKEFVLTEGEVFTTKG